MSGSNAGENVIFTQNSVSGSQAALDAIGARVENANDPNSLYAQGSVGTAGSTSGSGTTVTIAEGEGIVLDASGTRLPEDPVITYGEAQNGLLGKRVTYSFAWDLNGDGSYTEYEQVFLDYVVTAQVNEDFLAYLQTHAEPGAGTNLLDPSLQAFDLVARTILVEKSPVIELSWDDLVDFGFSNADIVGAIEKRLPLRITRVEQHFDVEGQLILQNEQSRIIEESDDEVTITVTDALPTLKVTGPAQFEVSLVNKPYKLDLKYSDPGGDIIKTWTVNWGDGTSSTYRSEPNAIHQYDRPGVYQTSVVAVDDDGNVLSQQTVQVTVSFGPDSVAVNKALLGSEITNGTYVTQEGAGIALQGAAAGTPDADSFVWRVNGHVAGSGQNLNLTWANLVAMGVTNDGTYDVTLTVTYNNGAEVVTSRVAPLQVNNVLPSGDLVNVGQWPQGSSPVVQFVNVTDPADITFSYQIYVPKDPDFVKPEPAPLDASSPNYAAQVATLLKLDVDLALLQSSGLADALARIAAIEELKDDVQRGADTTLLSTLGDALVAGADTSLVLQASTNAIRFSDGSAATQSGFEQALKSLVQELVDADGVAGATAEGRDAIRSLMTNLGRLDPASATFAADVQTIAALGTQVDAVSVIATNFSQQIAALVEQSNGLVFKAASQSYTLPTSLTARSGVYTVVGRIFDGGGYREVQTKVTVVNEAPLLAIDFNQTIVVANEGSVAIVTGTYYNPGGLPLRDMIAQYEGMADGETYGTVTFTQPDANGNGTWTWTHTLDDGPIDSQKKVIITAYDQDISQLNPLGTPTQTSFELQIINVGPTVELDPIVINEGTSSPLI
ncbi:PKD domain-containing protein [Verrucomicrobium spinosum]|uniref:PKD domain-containing protein n=1 Tax=Verrucomicrobium spinosum TaxID=2736 RepID=UPI0009466D74|nr:PKD domain-containing protein [Verrucomicrobium spinosum]